MILKFCVLIHVCTIICAGYFQAELLDSRGKTTHETDEMVEVLEKKDNGKMGAEVLGKSAAAEPCAETAVRVHAEVRRAPFFRPRM